MTIADWLAARSPRPPDALQRRIAAVMGDSMHADTADAASRFLATGERLVAELLATGSTSRETALDLLTADALVTYAFEAASEAPADLGERAAEAMIRIASLAVHVPPAARDAAVHAAGQAAVSPAAQ